MSEPVAALESRTLLSSDPVLVTHAFGSTEPTTGTVALQGYSNNPKGSALSKDGRFFVYTGNKTNLVNAQPSAGTSREVFLYDRQTGTNQLVGVGDTPSITDDGRTILYKGVVNGNSGWYAVDRVSKTTAPMNFGYDVTLSGGGRFLAANPGGGPIVIRDLQTGTTVSVGTGGAFRTQMSISDQGDYLVFKQTPYGTDPNYRIQLFNRVTGAFTQIVSSAGSSIDCLAISGNGQTVVYTLNGQLFAYQTRTGVSQQITQNLGYLGQPPSISDDGRFVTYDGRGPGEIAISARLFDLNTKSDRPISMNADGGHFTIPGTLSSKRSSGTALSGDGKTFTFVASDGVTSQLYIQSINQVAPVAGNIVVSYENTRVQSGGAPIDYGQSLVGQGVIRRYVQIINNGPLPLTIKSLSISGRGFSFEQGTPSTLVLPSGDSRSVSLLFDTRTLGTVSGTVTISTNDRETPTFRLNLKAEVATTAPEVELLDGNNELPSLISFGTTTLGTPIRRTFTLWNKGTADLKLQPIQIGKDYINSFSLYSPNFTPGQILRPGQSIAIVIQMNASKVMQDSDGFVYSFLEFATNDATEPRNFFHMEGRVNYPIFDARVAGVSGSLMNGQEINFGAVSQGSPTTKTFTIKNMGKMNLVIQPVVLEGSNFELASPNFTINQIVKPGATVSVSIRLSRNANSFNGPTYGKLRLRSNDPFWSNPDMLINLAGTVGSPEIDLVSGTNSITNGGAFSWGTVSSGTSLIREFRIYNRGTGPLVIQPLALTGTGYTLVSPNFAPNTIVAAGKFVSFKIAFTAPSGRGAYAGAVSFLTNDSDEGNYRLNLLANVLA